MLTVNTNSTALIAQNNLGNTQKAMENSMLKLSTGLRINSAADDAAGLQISNRMGTQISGLDVAMRNANDAISMAQTAEGAMQENTSIMGRMRDLALQSANDTNTAEDRAAMQKEIGQLQTEINRIAETTNFSGTKLLDGSADSLSFQIGSNANETITFGIGNMSTASLEGKVGDKYTATKSEAAGVALDATGTKVDADGTLAIVSNNSAGDPVTTNISILKDETIADITAKVADATGIAADKLDISNGGGTAGDATLAELHIGLKTDAATDKALVSIGGVAATKGEAVNKKVSDINLNTAAGAQEAIKILDGALAQVDSQRANLGAVQNRLDSTISNLSNIQENMTVSQSRILDVDFAKETTSMTKSQMLMQAGSSVLAQAKGLPQYAVQLMG
ncbi:flagellin [Endozoicomonas ascidiicola]|uniref:flagellin n=1 Tax=Endozoicomonas ascidiicola TaxID=1698521 RepID=UPI00082E4C80|nr:flagellin [Endozoicomonas ascidiicola]